MRDTLHLQVVLPAASPQIITGLRVSLPIMLILVVISEMVGSTDGIGYTIPPLWGETSFNAGAGMAKTAYAASYIRDNMPFGVSYLAPVLTVQEAWDVAAYMISKPHPPAPPAPAELQ